MENNSINFEEKLNKLDEIVDKISSQKLPIDESLALYEEAKQITIQLQKALDKARIKVENIVK